MWELMGSGLRASPSPVHWELVRSDATLGKREVRRGFAEQRSQKSARPSSGCFPPAFGSTPLKPTREVCDHLDFVAVARWR